MTVSYGCFIRDNNYRMDDYEFKVQLGVMYNGVNPYAHLQKSKETKIIPLQVSGK